ncbi:MAG: hypothetical protein H8E17_10785, partial [Deltaproteobacteria bacterium]|nr:hypothetical protein [Deltaproteobacteria bacterium]
MRELASTAYERELESTLEALYQLIHEFHQKKSRELWKIYNQTDNDIIVDRAVRLGILQQGEISAETAEAIHLDRHINEDRA